MKLTKYMFAYKQEDEKEFLLYNSFTGSLALITQDNYSALKSFENHGQAIADEELVENLTKGGFVFSDDFNEKEEIRLRLYSGRFNSDSLGITIAPTADCNFCCPYCYEKDVLTESKMSLEIQDAVVSFVQNRISNISNLGVTWYGGEPTLEVDIIEKISRELMKICEDNNLRYNAGIITNGYLLDRKMVSLFNELKINFYQITLDGDRETHDSRRYLKNGEATFDRILRNIIDCYDIIPQVSLRINVDRSNKQAGEEIFEILNKHGLNDKVKPYLGKVTNDDGSPDTCCLSCQEFAEKDLIFTTQTCKNWDWEIRYPSPKNHFCGADYNNAFVIGPNGALYKCWNDIGHDERSVGNIITNGSSQNRNVLYEYMLYDPLSNKKCFKCKMLPICLGGCPYFRHKKSPDNCYAYKSTLSTSLQYIANCILKERAHKENDNGRG